MTTPRTKAAPKLAAVDVPADNGAEPEPLAPKGSQRAALRRAQRASAKSAQTDPATQMQLAYQQLMGQAQELARDKSIAQKAAELSDTLLTEARGQLETAADNLRSILTENAALRAELDDLYDEHPELVPSDEPD